MPGYILVTPCDLQDLLCQRDTLLFIGHECVEPHGVVDFNRIADILHEKIGDPS